MIVKVASFKTIEVRNEWDLDKAIRVRIAHTKPELWDLVEVLTGDDVLPVGYFDEEGNPIKDMSAAFSALPDQVTVIVAVFEDSEARDMDNLALALDKRDVHTKLEMNRVTSDLVEQGAIGYFDSTGKAIPGFAADARRLLPLDPEMIARYR